MTVSVLKSMVAWGSLILRNAQMKSGDVLEQFPPRRVLQELDTSRDGKATVMAAGGNIGHVVFQELFQGVSKRSLENPL